MHKKPYSPNYTAIKENNIMSSASLKYTITFHTEKNNTSERSHLVDTL